MSELNFIEQALQYPNVVAFLQMIRKSEGTDAPDGYNYLFGSSPANTLRFTDFSRHPNVRRPYGSTFSTAAGAYQIMYKTDQELSEKLGLPDFSPYTQDIKAVAIMSERNCVQKLMNGDFTFALKACGTIWASLPGNDYGQPQHSVTTVQQWYENAGGTVA